MERRVEKPSDSEKDMIVKVKKSVVFEGEKKRIKKKKKKERKTRKQEEGGFCVAAVVLQSGPNVRREPFERKLSPRTQAGDRSIHGVDHRALPRWSRP